MEIKKNNCSFMISDEYSKFWFSNNKLDTWEQDTFHILEHYKHRKGGIYIDVGAWIGPTVLYAANIYKKVIAIEPDQVAVKRLKENLSANSFDTIVLIEKGLSSVNGTSEFGGNGELGNSESTLLISNKEEYLSYSGIHTTLWKNQQNHIVSIETITIESLIEQQNINPKDISLIKMDIEGGEKIVVPALIDFLKIHKPVFYISLHRCFLREYDIEEIINILFGIYDTCYVFSDNGEKKIVDKNFIQKEALTSLVFE
jgi:FkbM family methyltransferase